MPGVYEYVLTMQDKMSGTMQKLTGVTADTAARFAALQAKTDSLKQHTSDFGNTIGGLKQKLDLLRSERDLIDVGDVEKIKQYDKAISKLETRIGGLEPATQKAKTGLAGVIDTAWKFNQISELFGRAAESLQNITAPGVEFEQGMADLSAITGIAGKKLEDLGARARKVGKDTGVGAANAVEAYKLLASQIDVSKIGMDGLNTLQDKTITLAQASGLGMADAANALAGTINQFGLEAGEANRIINVLAAGAKYGAAEIPDLAESFKVAGATANAAGLSVEGAAGALETLSKMNLKGAEAGTALRNVLLKMQTELGVDFKVTKLSDALAGLAPKMADATFMAKTFGIENIAAAQFLAGNAALVEELTQRVEGTNVAYEQAAITTDTVSHKMQVLGAKVKDVGITIFEATKPMLSVAAAGAQTAAGIAQAVPVIHGTYEAFSGLASKMWIVAYAEDGVTVASKKFVLWEYAKTAALKVSAAAQWLYNGAAAVGGAVMAFLKSKVEGVRNAMATGTVGTYMMSGAMGVATGVAGAFSVALKAVGTAFKAIPVIGWIAAAIGALIALFSYLWNHSEKFRGFMGGLWGSVKAIFHNIGVFFGIVWENMIKPVFAGIGNMIAWLKDTVMAPLVGFFTDVWNGIVGGLQWLGNAFSGVWGWIAGILEAVGLRFTSFWDFVGSLFKLGAKIMFWPFTLLFKLFPNLGQWLEEKVWEPIKAVFEKIAGKIGKLIEPIKKIWGKLFKGDEYKDVGKEFAENSEKAREEFRKEKEKKTKPEAGIGDLMAGLEGTAPAINLKPAELDFSGGKKKDKTGKDKKDDTLSLGIPQDYNQSAAYSQITSKFGAQVDLAMSGQPKDKTENPTEKPVINMATRVDEIAGSLRKLAATAAIPVALTVGAGNAAAMHPETVLPENGKNITALMPPENKSTGVQPNVYNAFENISTSYENNTLTTTEVNNNSKDVRLNASTVNNTDQGKNIRIDRFTDKIEIHIHGADAETGKEVAQNVRDEVEKALAEILNV